MRDMILLLAMGIILAGCVNQGVGEGPTKQTIYQNLGNATVIVPAQPQLITSSDQGNVQVVTMKSVNQSFPMNIYDQRFLFAGLYSDTFVMLNNSQIKWLGPNESIWLTLYKGNGSGVLFNAIYLNQVQDCGSGRLSILGKTYQMSQLQNGSSFNNDDKWKVSIDSNGCPKQLIIYLDGYFDGLKDGEQIPIFRDDNTILLEFDNLETSPSAKVIATTPPT